MSTTTVAAPTRAYATLSFLTWLPVGLTMAPFVLLLLERGLSPATIAALVAVSSVAVAVLEVPTGGLADTWGRRRVLVLSASVHAVGLVLLGLATSVVFLVVSSVLRGAARALASGPLDAWFVDAHPRDDKDSAELGRGLAAGQVSASMALLVGVVLGGVVPLLVPFPAGLPALSLPVLMAAAVEVWRVAATLWLLPLDVPLQTTFDQASGAASGSRSVLRVVIAGLHTVAANAVVGRLLLLAGATGVVLATVELVVPLLTADVVAAPGRAGLVVAGTAAVGFAADALGGVLAPRVRRRVGSAVGAACGAAGLALLAVLLLTAAAYGGAGAAALGVMTAGYSLLFLALGIAGPSLGELFHQPLRATERATVLSVESLVFQLAGAGGVVIAGGAVAASGPWAGFAVAATAMAAGFTVLLNLRRCWNM